MLDEHEPLGDGEKKDNNDDRVQVKRRPRKIESIPAKKHFITYFLQRLDRDSRLPLLELSTDEEIDNFDFIKFSYDQLTDKQYQAWRKAWYCFRKYNADDNKYRYFLTSVEVSAVERLMTHEKYEDMTITGVIKALIFNEMCKLDRK